MVKVLDRSATDNRLNVRGSAFLNSVFSLGFWAIVGVGLLLLVLPLLVVVVTAVGKSAEAQFPPTGLSLRWFGQLGGAFWGSLEVSVALAILVVVLSMIVAVPGALFIVRRHAAGSGLAEAVIRSPLQVPYIVIGVAVLEWYTLLGRDAGVGLLGTFEGLALAHTVLALPFVFGAAVAGLAVRVTDLESAAIVLGASRLRVFWQVTLPAISPSLAAGAFFAFLVSLDQVPVSLLVPINNHPTLPVYLYTQTQFSPGSVVFAEATVATGLSLVIAVVYMKVVGLSSGFGSRL